MNKQILGSMVMAAFFAGAVGCNRTADESVIRNDTIVTETTADTVSGVTSANDPATSPETLNTTGAVPPIEASQTSSKVDTTTDTTTTETTKKSSKKHQGKKHKKTHDGAWISPSDQRRSSQANIDQYAMDDNSALIAEDDLVLGQDDFYADDTVSGMTMGADAYRSGLSPFIQEPASRLPLQIGSTSITGKDKSVSSLEGPSLFQEATAG
ncbi:MAG: hypothetical protein EOP05_15880, partial [Proteobacteria bacterium]